MESCRCQKRRVGFPAVLMVKMMFELSESCRKLPDAEEVCVRERERGRGRKGERESKKERERERERKSEGDKEKESKRARERGGGSLLLGSHCLRFRAKG